MISEALKLYPTILLEYTKKIEPNIHAVASSIKLDFAPAFLPELQHITFFAVHVRSLRQLHYLYASTDGNLGRFSS